MKNKSALLQTEPLHFFQLSWKIHLNQTTQLISILSCHVTGSTEENEKEKAWNII